MPPSLGTQFIDEMKARDLDSDPFSYEEIQLIKTMDLMSDIMKISSKKHKNVEQAKTTSDLLDIILDPENRIVPKWERYVVLACFFLIIPYIYYSYHSHVGLWETISPFIGSTIGSFGAYHYLKKRRLLKIKNAKSI